MLRLFKVSFFTVFFVAFLVGCGTAKKVVQKETKTLFNEGFLDNQFTGFLVIDADKKDTIYHKNHQKYFTPASNAKIATLYTALKTLKDSIPALYYIYKNNTLFIEGTGDPTFLHNYFSSTKTLNFLKKHKKIALHLNNFKNEKYGPGWSWEDYDAYYQPERNSFPMYGNVVSISKKNSLKTKPSFFNKSVVKLLATKTRELNKNLFYYPPKGKEEIEIPFKVDAFLTKALLEDVLKKKIKLIPKMPKGKKEVLFSTPRDTVLKRMMQESDNFLAEQLLVVAAATLSDTLDINKAQDFMFDSFLSDIKQKPRWVDGSGLSRYNLFTPESLVQLLDKLYTEVPKEQLFSYFKTYKELVAGKRINNTPDYIYAKSGSLSNNYCLSGYLITKSGKTLLFSFMNNHYRKPTSEVKKDMQKFFEFLRDTY